MDKFQVIKRENMPAIHSIEKDGVEHWLGRFQDFRWSEALSAFMPDVADFSLSWALLAHGEVLKAHTHPIQSMMVIYGGSGEVFGDLCRPLNQGDVLVVPPGCSHGFVGGPDGLHALTVQLGQGFYTDREAKPRIAFVDLEPSLRAVLEYNEHRLEGFCSGSMFRHLSDGTLRRDAFLNQVDSWHHACDVAAQTRRLTTRNERYLSEGVPSQLAVRSAGKVSDPVVKAFAGWLEHQMFVLDDAEKFAIEYLVLRSAQQAYRERAQAVFGHYGTVGSPLGEPARELPTLAAARLLRRESTRTFARLQDIVGQAWNIVGAMTDRIAANSLVADHTVVGMRGGPSVS